MSVCDAGRLLRARGAEVAPAPATAARFCDDGHIEASVCITVGVTTVSINGFSQNGNGFDAPDDENGWPNNAIGQPAHVAVWLR